MSWHMVEFERKADGSVLINGKPTREAASFSMSELGGKVMLILWADDDTGTALGIHILPAEEVTAVIAALQGAQ